MVDRYFRRILNFNVVLFFFFYIDDEDEMEAKTVAIRAMIAEKCRELGGLSFHESSVTVAFLALVLLWFFRSPGFMTGWGDLLKTTNAVGKNKNRREGRMKQILMPFLILFRKPCLR